MDKLAGRLSIALSSFMMGATIAIWFAQMQI